MGALFGGRGVSGMTLGDRGVLQVSLGGDLVWSSESGEPPVPQYALSFNGTTQYGSAGRVTTAEPGANEDFTAAVRFRHDGDATFRYPAVLSSSTAGAGYYIFLFGTNIGVGIDLATQQQLSITLPDPADRHNAALIRRSDNMYLYLDGTEHGPLGGFTNTGAISDSGMVFRLGSFDPADTNGLFEGLIEKVAYFGGVGMTASQLDAWFAASDVTTGNPTHAWALNEGTGSTAADAVGSADFTLYNDPTWELLSNP
jgi:hypothetical protein